jgi:uncharacterized protein (DUF1778 family)
MLTKTRTEQVSLRLHPDIKRVLQQGASVAGQTLTDFMVACSTDRAREILEQQRVITMSQTAFDAFSEALADPEIRPITPLAANAIEEYIECSKADGTFGW